MALSSLPLLHLTLLMLFLSPYLTQGSHSEEKKTWCVAKPSSEEGTLMSNLNYACSQVDCIVLQNGKPCFYPNNLMNHASIAMNLYYQAKGRNYWNCYFNNSGLVTITEPSSGSCVYA